MSSKSSVPSPAPAGLMPRPRLQAVFSAAFQRPLVVVHAGAGFGKTTAVQQYLDAGALRTVWFTFASPDNIPARFWEHLTRVFSQHRPRLGGKMKALGFPESLQAFSAFLADLTGELYEDERTVAFVFDDLHLVTEPAVHLFLSNLISARLENSHIVLLTRVWPLFGQPPAQLPAVLGVEALKFTPEETAAYLESMGLSLSPEAAGEIQHYVSGWPIALSLVAMAARHKGPESLGQTTLAATKPALYTLFEQEIFSQYSPAEQELLVTLSALDSFPRGLVQAVTGGQRRDLSGLLGGNIFIQYNADTMRLSFHPLYQEFLREKLLGITQATRDAAYRKAGDWCRENGHLYDAVRYYRQCGRHQDLWDSLLRIDAIRHNQRDAEFIIEQVEQLPPTFKEERPMTQVVLAVMLVNNLRFAEAAQVLNALHTRLEARADSAETRQLLGEASIARGLLLLAQEQDGFEIHFEKAARLLPQGSSRWNSKLQLIDLGPGLHLQSAKAGGLEKSLAGYTKGVPFMAKVLHGAGQGLDKLCQCEALFLTGQLKAAQQPAYQALYSAHAAGQYDIVGNALFMLLRVYTAQGDYAQLLDTLEHVKRYEADKAAQTLGIWDIIRGWFYAEMNEVERVATWIRNPVQKGFAPVSIDRPMLVRLRCLVAAGQYEETMALLEQIDALAKSKSAVITLLYVQLVRAVAHDHLGNAGAAAEAIRAVYDLAKGNRLVMPVVEYGNRTRLLLDHMRQTTGHGIPKAWLDESYAKASTYAKHHAYLVGRYRQEQEGRLTDYGLSARETELITHLSQGLTREEMAQEMNLSINTVKSLTKQAFAKLGAINSADAVRIAIVNQLI